MSGPNAAAFTTFLSSTSFTKTTTSLGFETSSRFAINTPFPLPVGAGPGTANCTGVPSAIGSPPAADKWPYPECDYTGYQTFEMLPGTVNTNTNEHFIDDYAITIDDAP